MFIDEVQYASEILRYSKMSIDKNRRKGAFVLTGSQTFQFMKGVSETLVGRMAVIEMQGLSLRKLYDISFYDEFIPSVDYINERQTHIQDYHDIWSTIHRRTMPELVDKTINWERYYSSYVKTYIEKDVRQIVNITDEMKFIKFLTALAARAA